MSEHAVVGLDLKLHTGTLADKIRRAGQAKALVEFAKEIEHHTRVDLDNEAQAETARSGGGGFTKKVDGVQAVVTDPQPKPHVTGQEAFKAWWVEAGLESKTIERAEVVDDDGAVFALSGIIGAAALEDTDPDPTVDWRALALQLVGSLDYYTEYVLPEKPLDRLIESGRCITTDTGLIDTTTGEHVPGVECRRQAAQLRVTPDKTAKARDRAIVASYFGLPAELPGGGA